MNEDGARARAMSLGAQVTAQPVRLTGGNLNHVFRVPTAEGTVILKHAPPHIASDPSIPLDSGRLAIEVEALRRAPQNTAVRVPTVLAHHGDAALLEDLGDLPHLGTWLKDHDSLLLVELGRFLAELHSLKGPDNTPVQHTRNAIQYRALRGWLQDAGLNNETAATHAEELGQRFLQPGRCFIMGDLWPRSVLVGERPCVIDWELAHHGVPAQDLGHLSAHLWMQAHVRGESSVMGAFFTGYTPTLTADDWRDLTWHAGCEILARTLGPFQRGYLYQNASNVVVREAVAEALRLLA